jgi:GR25 family glycosyltransferase involved in LPS biosynthesis
MFKTAWCTLTHTRHWRKRTPGFLCVCEKCGCEWRDPEGPVSADDIRDDTLIPVYVINLKESVFRREHMKQELMKAKIPFTLFPAINGKELEETRGTASKNQTACALSHLHAIRLIAEGKDEFGAVFEDDIYVAPDTRLFLDSRVLRTLPHFDIMHLCNLMKRSGLTINLARISGKYDIRTGPSPSVGMQALIYHRSAAQRIVREITEISAPIDQILFRHNNVFGLRIVSVRPAVVVHTDFETTIPAPQSPKNIRIKIAREVVRAMNGLNRAVSFSLAWTRGGSARQPAQLAPQSGNASLPAAQAVRFGRRAL